MFRVIVRLIADAALIAVAMFASAGTLAWDNGWALVGVMLAIRMVGAFAVYRVNPALLQERARLPIHSEQSFADRLLVLGVLATGLLGLPIIATLDRFRWHALALPTRSVTVVGLALFAIGWIMKSLALRANAFAVTVVRLQRDRAHAVVDAGPYAIVRHPFYAADPLIFVGLSLWLGSYLAAICAVVPIALMVTRLRLEERFLHRELPGYAAYAERVRFRLVPGLW